MEDMTFGGVFVGHETCRACQQIFRISLAVKRWITIALSLPSKALCNLEEIIPNCEDDIVVVWAYVCILTMHFFIYHVFL